MDHRHRGKRIIWRAIGDAHAQLDHHRIIEQPIPDQLLHEHQMPGIEHFEFGPHAKPLHFGGHGAQHAGRVGHHVIGFGKVHRAAIERADFGQQFLHMEQPLHRADHVGARRIEREGVLARAEHDIAAHSGGQIDHHIGIAGAHPLHHFAVKRHIAAALASFRIAHMDMRNRRPGACRLDRGIGDLRGRDGDSRVLVHRGARTSDRTGDERLEIHGMRSMLYCAAFQSRRSFLARLHLWTSVGPS